MKVLLTMLMMCFLVGCENSYEKIDFPVKPKELNDCSFYNLENKSGNSVSVVRCPNSSTTSTYQDSEGNSYVTYVTDGADNIPAEKRSKPAYVLVDGIKYYPK